MIAVTLLKALLGVGAIVLVFALFGLLLYNARRTHTRRMGGISIWEVLHGRFPRVRRNKKRRR